MKKIITFLIIVSLILISIPSSVFAVPSYGTVGPTSEFNGDVGTTGNYYINGTQIAVGDITGAAASGANSDITQLTGLTTALAANYGGTGVLNAAANTITFSGEYGLTLTLTEATSVTLPASGTLVNSAVTTLSSLASVGTVTTGTWSTGAVIGGVTMTLGSDAEYDVYYGGGNNVLMRTAPNTAASNKFFRMVGTGGAGQAPTWAALEAGDVPDISGTYQPLDTALTNISGLAYVSPSFIKLTDTDTYAVRTLAEVKEDLDLQIGTDIAACGANTDITSILNTALYVGRDADNKIDWAN